MITVLGGSLSLRYGTVAYATVSGNDLKLWYTKRQTGPAVTAAMTMLGFADQTANTILTFGGNVANEEPATNSPVVLEGVNNTTWTGGSATTTLLVNVAYRVDNY